MDKIRIILADDHTVMRAGLRLLLESNPNFEVVGEAADGEEVLNLLQKITADVLIIDLSMPNMSGQECIKEIKSREISIKILVLTMFGEDNYIREVMQDGAMGYVEKQALDTELFTAVSTVASGQMYLNQRHAQVLLNRLLHVEPKEPIRDPEAILSWREREVLKLMVRGYTMTEIGEKLFLSVKTVDTYKTRMMEKLGYTKKSELVQYALEVGLLSNET